MIQLSNFESKMVIIAITVMLFAGTAKAQTDSIEDKRQSIEFIKQLQSLTNSKDGNPLVILDGKNLTKEEVDTIDLKTCVSISVLKGESATDLYGEQATNGVIIITSKKGTNTVGSLIEKLKRDGIVANAKDGKPIFIIDGKETDNIENIPPEGIESVSILKDQSAVTIFGEKAKNGVVMITTKK